jgi:hypothetical protein
VFYDDDYEGTMNMYTWNKAGQKPTTQLRYSLPFEPALRDGEQEMRFSYEGQILLLLKNNIMLQKK